MCVNYDAERGYPSGSPLEKLMLASTQQQLQDRRLVPAGPQGTPPGPRAGLGQPSKQNLQF